MGHNQPTIAYTVIAKNQCDEISFLVCTDGGDYYFPYTDQMDGQTGLATALEALKRILKLDFNQLELAELTNVVVHDNRVPFFVFGYTGSRQLSDLLRPETDLVWESYQYLKDDLKEWNFSGVPLFK